MSLENFFKDLLTGNFTNAGKRIEDEVASILPAPVARIVNIVLSDTYKIVEPLVEAGAKDIIAGGLTTASFVAAGKDVLSKALSQGVPMLMQDVLALLNMTVAPQVAAPAVVPVPAAPAANA